MSTVTEPPPNVAFTTRPAGIVDVPAIVALVESAYRGDSSRVGWTTEADLIDGRRTDAEMIRSALVAVGQTILVAGPRDRPVACCALSHRDDRVWLGTFAVDPRRQGEGIGDRLLAEAERYATSRWAVSELFLLVIAQRPELIAWYERRGFTMTGETEPFPYGDERYGRPRRDDLRLSVMRHRLAGT